MPILNFHVEGKPVTQGSMNPGRNGKMFHKAALQPWRDLVWEGANQAAVEQAHDWLFPIPKEFPVEVSCLFMFHRPKKPTYNFPARADVDKLCRAVGDAISVPKKPRYPIITDDDQIVSWEASKIFSDSVEGVIVTISW